MKQSYDDIVEAIHYYASLEQYNELYAIISLLERHTFPQPIVEQLKGDLHYLFAKLEQARESYKQAATIYERNGEIKRAVALTKTVTYLETKTKKK